MYKKLIAPLQMWLLGQGKCVGCGSNLKKGSENKVRRNLIVKCPNCTRLYVKSESGTYRRALIPEIA